MKRMRTVTAVEILWDNIFDDDPSSGLTQQALDTLSQKEQERYATPEVFAGRFYHMTRAAYRGIYFLDDPLQEDMQAILREQALDILQVVTDDIDSLSTGNFIPMTHEGRLLMLYGQANEFTPIVVANASEGVVSLASRADDKLHRTDLVANFFDRDEAVPIQIKTSEDVSPSAAPDEGIVIVASDFGNEYLRVSKAALGLPTPENKATVQIAGELFTDTLHRRAISKEAHDKEIRELRARYKQRATKLTHCIGDILPELTQLRAELSLSAQIA